DLSPEEWQPGEAASRPHVALVPAPDGYRGRFRREEEGWAQRFARCVEEAAASLAESGAPLAALFVDSGFTSDGVLCPPPDYLRGTSGGLRRRVRGAPGHRGRRADGERHRHRRAPPRRAAHADGSTPRDR